MGVPKYYYLVSRTELESFRDDMIDYAHNRYKGRKIFNEFMKDKKPIDAKFFKMAKELKIKKELECPEYYYLMSRPELETLRNGMIDNSYYSHTGRKIFNEFMKDKSPINAKVVNIIKAIKGGE